MRSDVPRQRVSRFRCPGIQRVQIGNFPDVRRDGCDSQADLNGGRPLLPPKGIVAAASREAERSGIYRAPGGQEAVVAPREIRIAERRAAEEARTAREAAEKAAYEAAERAAQETALEAELAAEEQRKAREAAARLTAAEATAARDRALEAELLNTRKARKAARKAKKRGR